MRGVRWRMTSAPSEAFEPQVGWVYEQRSANSKTVRLRLVELPSGDPVRVRFDLQIPSSDLTDHFEAAP